jgi:hypothetical protein
MNWMQDRDLLIAQTMAFVHTVTGKKAEAGAPIEAARVDQAAEAARPVDTTQIARPAPARYGELREEIQGRVAAFRAHQEVFLRERDRYCNSVLTRVRASTGQVPGSPNGRASQP